MRQKFKLGFRNKSAAEQLAICEGKVAGFSAKPDQLDNPQLLVEASDAVKALRASHDRVAQLRSQLKAEVTNRNQLLKPARERVTHACLNAAVKVSFDPAGLSAAGLELEKPKSVPVGVPATPDHFRGEPTDVEGEACLRWKRTVRRCWFLIECCTDIQAGDWKFIQTAGQQTSVVKELKSGGKFWFRICAENSHGKSPWTQPVAVRVK